MVDSMEKVWKSTSAKVDAFQGARAGFELMTDQLRQATINSYYDYFDAAGDAYGPYASTHPTTTFNQSSNFIPVTYGRQSELHFISGPKPSGLLTPSAPAPSGQIVTQSVFFLFPRDYTQDSSDYGTLKRLLNASGFFIEFGTETKVVNSPPSFIAGLGSYSPKYRFRLMQFVQPTENLSIYNYSLTTGTSPYDWFVTPIANSHATCVRMVADNIIALIIWPKLTDSGADTLTGSTPLLTANRYDYDSREGANSGSNPWAPTTANSVPQPEPMNQMPPILKVAMVAIDEPSAQRIQMASATAPKVITDAIGLTANPSRFTTPIAAGTPPPDQMDIDLASLGDDLAGARINYRIFNTTIAVRSAKFSSK